MAPTNTPSVTPHHRESTETLGWPEREEIVRHLRDLASRIEHELWQKTYLPLASREVPPGPLTRDKDRDPFVAPVHQVLLELVGRSQGGDSASAQIAAINRRSRVVRNLLRTLDLARPARRPGERSLKPLQSSTRNPSSPGSDIQDRICASVSAGYHPRSPSAPYDS